MEKQIIYTEFVVSSIGGTNGIEDSILVKGWAGEFDIGVERVV